MAGKMTGGYTTGLLSVATDWSADCGPHLSALKSSADERWAWKRGGYRLLGGVRFLRCIRLEKPAIPLHAVQEPGRPSLRGRDAGEAVEVGHRRPQNEVA
jgi:hypothetical protein